METIKGGGHEEIEESKEDQKEETKNTGTEKEISVDEGVSQETPSSV